VSVPSTSRTTLTQRRGAIDHHGHALLGIETAFD
jgi:hypothetical protein